MFVKLYRADRCREFFNTDNYLIAPQKDINPIIVKIEIFNDGRRVYFWKRPKTRLYIKNYVAKN